MVSADISASLGFICAKLKVLLFFNGSLFLCLDWMCYHWVCTLVDVWTPNSRVVPIFDLLNAYLTVCMYYIYLT